MARKNYTAPLICLFIVLLLFPEMSRAQQDYHMTTGESFAPGNANIYPQLFYGKDTFYLLKFNNPDFFLVKDNVPGFSIESFDKDLHHTGSAPVAASFTEYKKLESFRILLTNNAFVVFASEFSLTEGTARSIVFKMNKHGQLSQPPVDLGAIYNLEKKARILYAADEQIYFEADLFHDGPDPRYLYIQQFPVQDQQTTRLMVKVLDTNLTVVRHKMLNLAIPPEYSKFSNVFLVNKELFFITTLQLPFEDELFKLTTYNFDKDELSYYDFSLEGKKIHSMDAMILDKGNILIHGLYAESSSRQAVDGLFYFLFDDKNQALLSTGFARIPVGQYKSIGKDDLQHLQIKEAYLRSNGDVLILSELYWTEVINFSDSEGKLYLRPFYHSDDMLVVSFSTTGTWKWHVWIPRKFGNSGEEMLGFHALMNDSSGYIIYNDHPDNVQIFDPDRIKPARGKFVPMLARLDLETGVFHKYPFVDQENKKTELTFRKNFTFNVSAQSTILIDRDGNCRLVGITFGASER